jgi:hypothetical protein
MIGLSGKYRWITPFIGGLFGGLATVFAIVGAWPDVRSIVLYGTKGTSDELLKKQIELVLSIAQGLHDKIDLEYVVPRAGRWIETPMSSSIADFAQGREIKNSSGFGIYYSPSGNKYLQFAVHADDIILPEKISKALQPFNADYIRYSRSGDFFADSPGDQEKFLLLGQSTLGSDKGGYLKSGSFATADEFVAQSKILISSTNEWLSSKGLNDALVK